MHFDNALYGYLVPIIAPLFFPNQKVIVQLILGYGLFITSFLAKPFGVLFFSKMAQTKEEAVTLRYTLLGAGISLIAIGFLPSYQDEPLWSVVLLILFRICIEACSAGEHNVAKLYLLKEVSTEQAKEISVFYEVSTMLGILLAGAVGTLFALVDYSAPYWRIPFVLAGVLTLLNLVVFRFRPTDSVSSVEPIPVHQKAHSGYFMQLWKERVPIMRIAIVTGFGHVTYIIPFVFIHSFVPMVTDISYSTMMQYVPVFMLLDIVLLSWMGSVCRKYDHNNLMAVASLLIGLSIIPLFRGLSGASMLYVTIVRCWLIFCGVVFSCFITVWSKEQISKTTPYLTIGFATVLGSSLFGKSATTICFYLFHWSNNPMLPACYIAILAIVSAMIMADSASE